MDGSGKVTIGASGTYRVYPSVHAVAAVFALCGPYVDVQPGFLELQADTSANPWWHLDAGVHLSAGAECPDFDAGPIHVHIMDPWEFRSADVARDTIKRADGAFAGTTKSDRDPGDPPASGSVSPDSDVAH